MHFATCFMGTRRGEEEHLLQCWQRMGWRKLLLPWPSLETRENQLLGGVRTVVSYPIVAVLGRMLRALCDNDSPMFISAGKQHDPAARGV